MNLSEILTISGKPGLYKLVTNNKGNFIVESLNDHKRFPAFARDKVSPLEEISIFTNDEDMPLREVFTKLYTFTEKTAIETATITDNEKLKKLFDDFIPDYDKDRLYVSHMKKIVSWYNELLAHDLLSEDNTVTENVDSESPSPDNNFTKKTATDKPNISALKKTNIDKPLPKKMSTKNATPSKTISTKPKAK